MRIKTGEYIQEVNTIWIRSDDIEVNNRFYQTKEYTNEISTQLLEKGYADLTKFPILF